MGKLSDWDSLHNTEGDLIVPDEVEEVEHVEAVPVVEAVKLPEKVEPVAAPDTTLSHEHEIIAQAMLMTRGNLAKASRLDSVDHNAMSLRAVVKANPAIRTRYQELLAEEMQEKGLHIAERILSMAELQEQAFGHTIVDSEGNEIDIPADPKTVIDLSKEISRLIAEGKSQNISAKSAVIISSKEDAKEILAGFLDS